MKLILIALGGGLGAVARYGLAGWISSKSSGAFPLGTLCVNVLGCFLIGFGTHALTSHFEVREELRLALLVGLLGGFTTFSTYAWETFARFEEGDRTVALLYLVASNALGLGAAWAGFRFALALFGKE